jgi:hypothetical protein
MKNIKICLSGVLFMIFLGSGCRTVVHVNSPGHEPPGQVKKMTGSQSAKPYAPGQQKEKKHTPQ